jgi:pyroglutamyl-peptidase
MLAAGTARPRPLTHNRSKDMRRSRPVILITGFGPFPGAPQNASSLLAEAVAEAARGELPGFKVHAETLPTEWQAGPARLAGLLDEHQPTLALHFGVSRRATGFVIETRARNATQCVADACGEAPRGDVLLDDGPDEIGVTLPTSQIVDRLRRLRLPVQLSRDAGGYLCNALLYHSLDHARRRSGPGFGPRRGFIHIPDRLVGGKTRGVMRPAAASRLEWDGAVRGGMAILATCAGVGER